MPIVVVLHLEQTQKMLEQVLAEILKLVLLLDNKKQEVCKKYFFTDYFFSTQFAETVMNQSNGYFSTLFYEI